MIEKGMQWRVGNGASIRIYQDEWLPNPRSRKVVSPRGFFDNDAQVFVLIDHEKRCWIKDVIDNIFLPHEATLIKSIPLSLEDCEDKLFWPWSSNGVYSVKSGYKLLMEKEREVSPTTSDLSLTKKCGRVFGV